MNALLKDIGEIFDLPINPPGSHDIYALDTGILSTMKGKCGVMVVLANVLLCPKCSSDRRVRVTFRKIVDRIKQRYKHLYEQGLQ